MRVATPVKCKYIWESGEFWLKPSLRFTKRQWEFMQEVMAAMRDSAQDQNISDSKCIEFAMAEWAASYGISPGAGDGFFAGL